MTVSAQTPRHVRYLGDGGAGPFAIPFPFLETADIRAQLTDETGVTTPLTGLTVTGASDPDGGAATTAGPILAGQVLTLWSATAIVQPTDYIAADAFPAESHEAALDRLTLIAQDLKRDLDRSFKLALGETAPEEASFEAAVQSAARQVTPAALALIEAAANQAAGPDGPLAETLASGLADLSAAGDARITAIGAAVGSTVYADTTAGLAATADQGYFWVVGTGDAIAKLYKDNAGTAVLIADAPSWAALVALQDAIDAKIAFFPGSADLLFESAGGAASLYVASGASIDITADDIDHPAITALQLYSPSFLPGPDSYAVFEDGTHVVTVYQEEQDAIAGLVEDMAALDTVTAAFDSGEMAATADILLIGDSLTTDSQGIVDELTTAYPARTVTGQGVSGQKAAAVAARLGVAGTLTVSGSSIPASGSGVTCTSLVPDPFEAGIGDPASFLACVGDVPGVLSKSGSTVTFTRSDTGGAISASGSVAYRLLSTFAANTRASGVTLLSSLLNRLLVLRVGHNDVYKDVIRDEASYSRQSVKDWISAAVARQSSAAERAVVCGITRGYAWLTQARVDALLGSGSGIVGYAADDAETIEAVIEANALNQWMADTFPGFADLMGAYVTAGYVTSVNLGSGHVYPFVDATRFTDGTHGTDGGTAQNLDVTTISAVITAKGW
jgi:hypothetical protein